MKPVIKEGGEQVYQDSCNALNQSLIVSKFFSKFLGGNCWHVGKERASCARHFE